MDSEENTPQNTESQPVNDVPQAPVDALSRTPDDLEREHDEQVASDVESGTHIEEPQPKKGSRIKRFFRKVNVYFLVFVLLLVISGAISTVNYLNSKKTTPESSIAAQELTEEALKQLTNTDASVGNTSQTLTIQGNAIIAGQTLMRGNLNVAGNLQTGGSIQGPSLTISGASNLGEAQINSLQVATNTAVQGSTTLRDLSVSGTSSFSGAITASQITVTRLIISGNGVLQVPNHISFAGPAPSRTINGGVLGGGGSASVDGSDTSGTVNINTGNNPTPGCFIQIKFNQRFTNNPHVMISPVGAAAGQTQYYATRTNTEFSVCSANAAPANQTFAFDYFITN